jgi:hypothetical protein
MIVTARECRRHAENCIEIAEGATPQHRAALLRMAETWIKLADEQLFRGYFSEAEQNAGSTSKLQ